MAGSWTPRWSVGPMGSSPSQGLVSSQLAGSFQDGRGMARNDPAYLLELERLRASLADSAAGRAFQGQQADAQRAFEGQQAGAGRDLQFNLAGMANDTTRRAQDFQLKAAEIPYQYKRGVFDQVFPLIQGALGGSFGQGGTVGGATTPPPAGAPRSVWDDAMVQQQVNAGSAQNAMAGAAAKGRAADELGSRGFGAGSPLLAALKGAIDIGTTAANSDLARQTRWDAARGNAAQATQAANLDATVWQAFNDLDVRRRQSTNQSAAQLIAALSGLL